jgi:peptidoglycan/xylan/chitin deacetylase (PgdA/CDA1 family)
MSYAQKKVSITIDDVPNTGLYQSENYKPVLLNKLDSLDIPITIFINEGLIYKTDSVVKNFALLNEWVKNKNIVLGNHTFSHPKYSKVGIERFTEDVKKGESIIKELAKKYNKQLKFFRFPYNDLGKDSLQHFQIDSTLKELGYINTPFTVESSDWMFDKIYTTLLERKDYKYAKETGELYVSKTLEYFHFFDSISTSDYGRDINHIYLCHDNKLNADYLVSIISQLKNNGYEIASLQEVLSDEFYNQKDEYYFKWGVSWYYRYMNSHKKREKVMRSEPDMDRVYQLYNDVTNNN